MKPIASSTFEQLAFEPSLISDILALGRQKKVNAEQLVVDPAAPGDEVPFVLTGILKVSRIDDAGNEVFLYYLEGGETCAMSINCCLEGTKAAFKLVAETDATLWMIPMIYMDKWVTKYTSFRKFVFSSYQARFDELLGAIDSVVFHNMDERLYRFLLDTKQATGSFQIHKTHEQIAGELSTSRVVISRLLKQLERAGKIEQYRNRIEIL